MALRTLGTTTTVILSAFTVGVNDVIQSDVATMLTQIRADEVSKGAYGRGNNSGQGVTPSADGNTRFRVNQPYLQGGQLWIPNRGKLQLRVGDVIAWDNTGVGWPMVVSGDAIVANGATSRWVLT